MNARRFMVNFAIVGFSTSVGYLAAGFPDGVAYGVIGWSLSFLYAITSK